MAGGIDLLIELIKTESSLEEACSRIVFDLNNGSLSLHKLIQNLGELLTNQDIVLRRGGLDVVGTVLEKLEPSFLSAKEIEFLVGYFCNCLLDHHSFISVVLKGFLALVKMESLPDGVVSRIFTILNLNITCQSQPHADRNICYQLLNGMMQRKSKELQALGPDFVCGYLSFIDSERDPRNLMYLFKHLPFFYQTFPPGHLLEDAFEAASCYFPIDFRTNPKDPRGISRDDLSAALMPCLTAIDDFCSFAIALALDKLSSDLTVAKVDSLALLKKCFDVFPPDKLCPSVTEIVSSLLNEVKPSLAEAEIRNACIDVLVALFKYLAVHGRMDDLVKTWSSVCSSVRPFLNDIHLTFFLPAVKFIAKIASACDFSCQCVISTVVPILMSLNLSSDSDVAIVLEALKLVLPSCVTFSINCADMKDLGGIWSEVPQLFLTHCGGSKTELRILAIEGATSVVQLFNPDQRLAFYSILCHNVEHEQDVTVRQKSIDCIRVVAEIFPDEIKRVLDCQLKPLEYASTVDLELRKRVFQCWCALASVPGFLSYLDQAVKKYIVNSSYEYSDFVIDTLRELVVHERNNSTFLNSLHHEVNITRHLMDWWHEGCNAISDDVGKVFDDENMAENLQFIICIIVRVLDEKSQLEIAVHSFQLTEDYSKRFMNSFQYLNGNDDLNTSKVHCSLSIITFESIVNGLLPVVLEQSCSQCLTQIIKYLAALAVYCSRPVCCSVACRSIATVFNKLNGDTHLEEQSKFVFFFSSVAISKKDGALKTNAVNLLIYAAKSLLLRGYLDLNPWLDKLLSLLADESVSNTVAEGFRIVCREDEYFLNDFCHFSVKLFYRQRLFSYIVPKLVDLAKGDDHFKRINCAASAAYLMKDVPQSVIARYFKQMIPLLIELLNVNCQLEVSLVTLQKLTTMLADNAAIFEEYIETFIPKLLLLSRDASNMKVRMAALQCLAGYSKLTPSVILPFKAKVVYELVPCLDDRKRLVRQEAVKTRTRWMILGVS